MIPRAISKCRIAASVNGSGFRLNIATENVARAKHIEVLAGMQLAKALGLVMSYIDVVVSDLGNTPCRIPDHPEFAVSIRLAFLGFDIGTYCRLL